LICGAVGQGTGDPEAAAGVEGSRVAGVS